MKRKISTRSTLSLLHILSMGACTTEELAQGLNASIPTVRRMIKAAREMGADISIHITKNPSAYSYQLKNWEDIQATVESWLQQYIVIEEIELHALKPNILKDPQALSITKGT